MSTNPPTLKKPKKPNYISTTNACKLCTPLGACLAFKGIEGAVPYLHGSQGCATCLTETIGDDVRMYLHQYAEDTKGSVGLPTMVHVSTPSSAGTHMEGVHAAIRAVVAQLSQGGPPTGTVNLLPGFVSSADYRLLCEIMAG